MYGNTTCSSNVTLSVFITGEKVFLCCCDSRDDASIANDTTYDKHGVTRLHETYNKLNVSMILSK